MQLLFYCQPLSIHLNFKLSATKSHQSLIGIGVHGPSTSRGYATALKMSPFGYGCSELMLLLRVLVSSVCCIVI